VKLDVHPLLSKLLLKQPQFYVQLSMTFWQPLLHFSYCSLSDWN